jgi:SAM-dependent methyltransferase
MRGKYLISFEDNWQDPLFLYDNWFDGVFDRGFVYPREPDLTPMVSVDPGLRRQLAEAIGPEPGGAKPLVLLNFMAAALSRRLPPEVVGRIVDAGKEGYQFVFINQEEGRREADRLPERVRAHVLDWSPLSVSVRHYIALMSLLDGVITCDSAPLHIAAALGLPTVCLFSTYHRKKYPYGTAAGINWDYRGSFCQAPCNLELRGDLPCPEARVRGGGCSPCLQDMPAGLVLDTLAHKLQERAGRSRPPAKGPECWACGARRVLPPVYQNGAWQYECADCGLLFSTVQENLDYAAAYGNGDKDWLFQTAVYDPGQFQEGFFLRQLNAKRTFSRYPFIVRILNSLRLRPSHYLLEVGAGTGRVARYVADNVGCEVYCTEASKRCTDFIEGKLGIPAAPVTDLSNLPPRFPTLFDAITCFEVMEHVPRPLAFLKQMVERLTEDGYLLFSVPNKALDDYLRENKARRKDDYPPHHLSLWTEQSLRRICKRAGLPEPAIARMPIHPGRLFSCVAPLLNNVHLGAVFASMLRLLKDLDVFDCWFVLCARTEGDVDLDRLLHCALVKTLFRYRVDEVIGEYGTAEEVFHRRRAG